MTLSNNKTLIQNNTYNPNFGIQGHNYLSLLTGFANNQPCMME